MRVKPEDCNLDTTNFIIIWYHNYSGGKFMLNCLALNELALFPHDILAQKQIEGEFTVEDKMDYLRSELGKITKGMFWTDLNLSDNIFFGFDKREYADPWRGIHYKPIVKDVSFSEYKFFRASHDIREVRNITKIWKNAKIILFTHPHAYVEKRAKNDPKIRIYYEQLKYHEEHLEELRNFPNVIYEFDVRKYESETETLDAVRDLYEILDLPNYNREFLSEYYNLWYNKIEEIKL